MANLGGSGGIYGKAAPRSILPGDTAVLIGLAAIPGFFGSGGSGSRSSGNAQAGVLPESTASSPVVIAARPGDRGSSQRQLIWRVNNISGEVSLNLQVSIDDVNANYVTIDSVSGASTNQVRNITADIDSSGHGGPAAQGTSKVLASARFIRVVEGGAGSATCICDVTCQ